MFKVLSHSQFEFLHPLYVLPKMYDFFPLFQGLIHNKRYLRWVTADSILKRYLFLRHHWSNVTQNKFGWTIPLRSVEFNTLNQINSQSQSDFMLTLPSISWFFLPSLDFSFFFSFCWCCKPGQIVQMLMFLVDIFSLPAFLFGSHPGPGVMLIIGLSCKFEFLTWLNCYLHSNCQRGGRRAGGKEGGGHGLLCYHPRESEQNLN